MKWGKVLPMLLLLVSIGYSDEIVKTQTIEIYYVGDKYDPFEGTSLDRDLKTSPIMDWILSQTRAEAGIYLGWTSYYFKGILRFKFIWDPDSVIAGDSFKLKIVAELDTVAEGDPWRGGKHEMYSNMGFDAHIGLQGRSFRISEGGYTDWYDLPVGIGFDGNLHIAEDGVLPMQGDSMIGEDVLNITGIGLDIIAEGGGSSGGGGGEKHDWKGEGSNNASSGKDALGLINLLGVNFGFSYKLENGHILANFGVGGTGLRDTSVLFIWNHSGDTNSIWIHVNVNAQPGETWWVYLTPRDFPYVNKFYSAYLYWKGFLSIDVLGVEVGRIESGWVEAQPNEIYFDNSQDVIGIGITIKGTHAHPSLSIDYSITNVQFRFLGTEITDEPEKDGLTFINAYVRNDGTGIAHGYTVKFVYPETVRTYQSTDWIYQHDYASVIDTVRWQYTGDIPVQIILIPNPADSDDTPLDDTAHLYFHVNPHKYTALIALVDTVTHDTIGPQDSIYTTVNVNGYRYSTQTYPDTSINQWNRWVAYIPGNVSIHITAIPDTSRRDYFQSTVFLDMDTVTQDPIWIYIPVWKTGTIAGHVYSPEGNPISGLTVYWDNFDSTKTDANGYYTFDHIPETNSRLGAYWIKVLDPAYKFDSISVYVTGFDTTTADFHLAYEDTVPPTGTLSLGPIVRKTTTILIHAVDTLTSSGDTLPPAKIIVRDNNSPWDTLDYPLSYDYSLNWTFNTSSEHNEVDTIFVKLVDRAGNISDSIYQSVTVDQDGPFGHFSISDTATVDPNISISVTVDSTLVPAKRVMISERGAPDWVTYSYQPGNGYTYRLSSVPGYHMVYLYFVDSLGVASKKDSQSVRLDYYGHVVINSDSTYTNSSTVNLDIFGGEVLASNLDSSGGAFGGYPLAQSFTPHSPRISQINVLFHHAPYGMKVALYKEGYDSVNEQIVPDSLITVTELEESYSVPTWVSIVIDSSVTLEPDSTYMIAIYKDSLNEGYVDYSVYTGNDENYTDGTLYGEPSSPYWYELGNDMTFSIIGPPDSMQISNYPDFSGASWIPYTTHYANWVLLPGEGMKTVYVKISGNPPRTFSDAIIVDETPPQAQVTVLNRGEFLDTPRCTLQIYIQDPNGTPCEYNINNDGWISLQENPLIREVQLDSGAPGPRQITVYVRDEAGNTVTALDTSIDYDPAGPEGYIVLGDSGFYHDKRVPAQIVLSTHQGKAINVERMRLSVDGIHWGDWQDFSQSFYYTYGDVGPVPLYAELEDNYEKRGILFGSCLIDTTPPPPSIFVRDEGDSTESHDSLSFTWLNPGDEESDIHYFVIKISTDSSFSTVLYSYDISASVRSARVGPMTLHGDSTYYAKVITVNRAGLTSESAPTDGITVINGIQHFNLISPQDSTQFQQGDTITLVWHEAKDILSTVTNYSIYINSQLVANVTDTSWVVNINLQEGWHRWFVVAQDSLLDQRHSDTLHFHIGTIQPPPTPTALTPSDTFLNHENVTFVWSPNTKLSEETINRTQTEETVKVKALNRSQLINAKSVTYTIEVSTDSLFNTLTDSATVFDTTTSITLANGRYYWRVNASNEGGSSSWSNVLTFVVDTTLPGQPVIISPASGDTIYSDSVEFSWFSSGDNFGISLYRLNYWGAQSGSYETPDTSVVLELGSGTYYFTITAIDSAGNLNTSDTSWFVIEHITLPTPILISPANDSMTNYRLNMHFVWRPGSKIEKQGVFDDFRNKKDESALKPTHTFIFQLSAWDSTFGNLIVIDTLSDTTIALDLPEAKLFWRVREIDDQGNLSYWTDTRRLVVDTTRPTAPYQISPRDSAFFDTNVVTFTWSSSFDALSGLSHYQLEYNRLYGDTSEYYNINLTDTTVTVEIPRNGEWAWCVVAFDSAGNSEFSGWRDFSVNYQPPLPVPTLIEPVNNQWVWSMVTFRWQVSEEKIENNKDNLSLSGVKDTLSYILQVWHGEQMIINDTLAQDSFTTFIWTSGPYYWHVQTYYAGRTSEWSPTDSFRVDAQAPPASTPLYPGYGYYITSLPYEFVWTSSTDTLSGFAGYRLLIANNPDMMEPVIDTTLFDTTYTLTNLEDGTWYWQVRNYDSVGNGEFSEIVMFHIDTTPPEPVQLIAPEDSMLYGFGDLPVFIWHSTEGRKLMKKSHNLRMVKSILTRKHAFKSQTSKQVVFYELLIAGNNDTLIFPELEDTIFWLDTLLEDGWYSWWVRAYDEAGNYSSSEVWVFGTDTTPPLIESTTVWHDTSFAGPFEVRTRVTDANGVSDVKLFYMFGTKAGDFDSVEMQPDTVDDFYYAFIPQVTSIETVYYYIHALDSAWEPNESYDPEEGAYTFVVTPVGIGESSIIPRKFELMGIRPNPVRKGEFYIYLSIPKRSNVKLEIFDVSGRRVLNDRFLLDPGYRKIRVRGIPKGGIYFVIVSSGDSRFIRKIIVIE